MAYSTEENFIARSISNFFLNKRHVLVLRKTFPDFSGLTKYVLYQASNSQQDITRDMTVVESYRYRREFVITRNLRYL